MRKLFTIGLLCLTFLGFSQDFEIQDLIQENGNVTIKFKINGRFAMERYTVKIHSSHNNYETSLEFVTGDVTGEVTNSDRTYTLIWNAQRELKEFDGEIQLELRGEVTYLPINSEQGKIPAKHGQVTQLKWSGGNPTDEIKIELLQEGQVINQIIRVPNSGAYDWSVTKGIDKGKGYQLRYSNISNSGEMFESESFAVSSKLPLWLKAGVPVGSAVIIGGVVVLMGQEPGTTGGNELPEPPSPGEN